MTSGSILSLYLILFSAEFLFEQFLTVLNMREVDRNRGEVPPRFTPFFDRERYSRSVEYTLMKSRLSLVSAAVSSGVLLAFILSGALGGIDRLISGLGLPYWLHGIAYVFLLSIVFRVVSLPAELYSRFVIEQRFGFNTTTLRLFVVDLLKGLVVSAALGFPVLAALFWFMNAAGAWWWVFAFLFIGSFQLFITLLYPVVIAPLFNKFAPLADGELDSRLRAMADRLSFATKGIFVMDGSRRSRHANAYFTGFGKSKRIVLYDTLINELSAGQIEAVLAHEIGHEKGRHTVKFMAVSLSLILAGLFVVSVLLTSEPLFEAFGFGRISYHGILVILSFCAGPFTFVLTPLFTSWSRRYEYQADRFAIDAMGGSADLVSGLIALGKGNLSNLTPHRLYSFYHYSHPTLSERVAAADRYAADTAKA